MRVALKIAAVLVVGIVLGLAATWFTVFRGTLAGGITDGPWRTSLEAGSSQGDIYLRARVALHGLLALNRSETIYYTTATDGDGAALSASAPIASRDTIRRRGGGASPPMARTISSSRTRRESIRPRCIR